MLQYLKNSPKNKKLESDFSQAYRYIRDLFICEMTDSEFIERDVLGHTIDSLKDITHNTVKYFKTGHLFEINADFGEDVIDINCLHTYKKSLTKIQAIIMDIFLMAITNHLPK